MGFSYMGTRGLLFHVCFKPVFPYIQGCMYIFKIIYCFMSNLHGRVTLTFTFGAFSRHLSTSSNLFIHAVMEVAAMRGADQHIRSRLGFTILPKSYGVTSV